VPIQPLSESVYLEMHSLRKSRKHLEEKHKRHVCTMGSCVEDFARRYNLTRHVLTVHGGDLPFKCDQCFHRFPTVHELKIHIAKNHHKDGPKFPCGEKGCNKSYASKENLSSHMRETHSAAYPYICEVCGKGFYTKGWCENHMSKKHFTTR
jgi:KRAB domain-containing zinc finger protein